MERDPEQALTHLVYEIEMLRKTTELRKRFEDSPRGGADEVYLRRAVLEANLLHTRVVAGFLLGARDRKTGEYGWYGPHDIKPSDFDVEWAPAEESKAVQELKDAMPDLHKYLAHLTWARTGIGAWWDGNLVDSTFEVLGDFVRSLPPDSPAAARLRQELDKVPPPGTIRLRTTTNDSAGSVDLVQRPGWDAE